jgi:type VI secretion system ImpM family protein
MPTFRGFFGKLPARGDFVSAGLPRDFVSRWDAWISSTLAAAVAAAGDDWLQTPPRRFHLAPGVCCPDAVMGVLLPSSDKVGRRFPLTLAWNDDVDIDAAERLGLTAIQQAMPPEILVQHLANIAPGNGEKTPPPAPDIESFAAIIIGNLP